MEVLVSSFGHRYGECQADHVVDLRGLRDPAHDRRLRRLDGFHPAVQAEVLAFGPAQEALAAALEAVGQGAQSVAFGCSAGRHRSVVLARACAAALLAEGYEVRVDHRDQDSWYQG